MMKATVVPAAMSAVQSKRAPLGGFKTKDEPPGTIPCKGSEKCHECKKILANLDHDRLDGCGVIVKPV